jgi:hypothetical protein
MKSASMRFYGRRANLTGIADIYPAFPPEKFSLVNPGSGTRSQKVLRKRVNTQRWGIMPQRLTLLSRDLSIKVCFSDFTLCDLFLNHFHLDSFHDKPTAEFTTYIPKLMQWSVDEWRQPCRLVFVLR